MSRHIYPLKLEELIKEKKYKYIPRRIKKDENLKLFKRYWSSFRDLYFKVQRVYTIEEVEYYSIKYDNTMFGELSYPLDHEYTYELLLDKNNIKDTETIINNKISYSGAEIKYWFHINNIENPIYNGFWSFVNSKSQHCISDNKFYFLYALDQNGIYKDCRIVLDYNRRK